jgi:hypothetical protein
MPSLLPGWPQQDLADGQAAWTAEDERDDLGDVCSGDLGLVVEFSLWLQAMNDCGAYMR